LDKQVKLYGLSPRQTGAIGSCPPKQIR